MSTNCNNKQNNCKQKKDLSMKDLLAYIEVTAPVFHAEMSELKAELEWNTAQTTAGGTTNSGGRRERWIQEIKSMMSTTTITTTNNTIATNERSINLWKTYCKPYWSRLPCSISKCPNWRLYLSRTLHKQQQVEQQQVEGGGGDEFNKYMVSTTTTTTTNNTIATNKRSITRWKTYCQTYWSLPPYSILKCPGFLWSCREKDFESL